jgi:hypothetical protein
MTTNYEHTLEININKINCAGDAARQIQDGVAKLTNGKLISDLQAMALAKSIWPTPKKELILNLSPLVESPTIKSQQENHQLVILPRRTLPELKPDTYPTKHPNTEQASFATLFIQALNALIQFFSTCLKTADKIDKETRQPIKRDNTMEHGF